VAKQRKRRQFFSAKEIPSGDERELYFLDNRFVVNEGVSVSTQVNRRMRSRTSSLFERGRRQADWVGNESS